MNLNDPVLGRPQEIEYDDSSGQMCSRLANHDVVFQSDSNSDLFELQWPWANERYVKSIRIAMDDPRGEELMPLVTRYYPGYQETILGNEGMIISKRLSAPLGSHYDRSALWTLECQAEGDRLLRLVIDIDWGESLAQRNVDGLLVAQRNPSRAQGIYKQRNADRTCVFGNPLGRPSAYKFDDEGRAQLTYFVLVNGIVEVSLLLTVSDVGEQVAWNGFLALRDTEREFDSSTNRWAEAIQAGRLWTSNPQLNRAVQVGRIECLRSIQRMRTGMAPTSRQVLEFYDLINCCDTTDINLSRNLLAHLRRLAIRSEGRLPLSTPIHPKDALDDVDTQFAQTNYTYIRSIHRHLQHHPDDELLAKHYDAIDQCAERLVQYRWRQDDTSLSHAMHWAAYALEIAVGFAATMDDDVNVARWQSESNVLRQMIGIHGVENGEEIGVEKDTENECESEKVKDIGDEPSIEAWITASTWQQTDTQPWAFDNTQHGIALAGGTVWSVCNLKWYDGTLWVVPNRIEEIHWWALVDYPVDDRRTTLVWDGNILHSTYPVQCSEPISQYDRIRVRGTDEHSFDLRFEMIQLSESDVAGRKPTEVVVHQFRPEFDTV